MISVRKYLASVVLGLAASIPFAKSAHPYPVDCAILLCLAGGFPTSVECSAAKVELIRRITPWPIEPPLQLWRCPMGGGSVNLPGEGGSDGLPPEVTKYRDAIEVWQLSKHVTNGSGGRDLYLTMSRYTYTPSGDFVGKPVGIKEVPVWLDDEVRQRTRAPLTSEYGKGFRSIVVRLQDYTGAYLTEWTSY